MLYVFFFFNDTATTEIYTLSLHDALPISDVPAAFAEDRQARGNADRRCAPRQALPRACRSRSEEHTSELQSRQYLVCRLLLEKKNQTSSSGILHGNRTSGKLTRIFLSRTI